MPELDFISTGFRDVDAMLGGGLLRGQLVLLAGVTGIGKSALASDMALNVAMSQGLPVLYVSTETAANMLAIRWACALSGHHTRDALAHDAGELYSGALDAATRNLGRIAKATGLSTLTSETTPQGIRNAATDWCRDLAQPGFIVVDGLTSMELPPDGAEAHAVAARSMKALAMAANVPVLLTSNWFCQQGLFRKRLLLGDRPDMDDAVAVADIVLFLHRDDHFSPEHIPGRAELIIAKHRTGPTGTVPLRHELTCFRFCSLPAEVR